MKRVKTTGGKRMMELGKKPVQIWMSQKEFDLVTWAAKLEYRSLASYVLQAVIEKARSTSDR